MPTPSSLPTEYNPGGLGFGAVRRHGGRDDHPPDATNVPEQGA
jgi:hypothetical protein